VLIHPLRYANALITLFKGCTITATSNNGLCPTLLSVAHETPVTPPSKNSNSLSKRRILPCKVNQRCLYIWESTSLVSNAVTTRSASKKQKLMMIS
jgi:hypothetical protein